MPRLSATCLLLLATLLSIFYPARLSAQQIELLWLGHSTVRITSVTGKVIVIDPFLTRNPQTPARYRNLEALGKVDLILVTHGHPDHTGDLPELARLTGAKVIANYEYARNLVELGLLQSDNVIGMNKGGAVEPLGRGITVHMVPADHSSSIDFGSFGLLSANSKSLRYYGGDTAVGYVLAFENGFKIYHSGDTAVFGDMALIHRFFQPDVALVCIGGYYTMGPEEAAYALRELLKPKKVIPIHWGTYSVINRKPAELKAALGDAPIEMLDVVPGQIVKF